MIRATWCSARPTNRRLASTASPVWMPIRTRMSAPARATRVRQGTLRSAAAAAPTASGAGKRGEKCVALRPE